MTKKNGQTGQHTLTVFNGVDVPEAVAAEVMRLLQRYDPDIYRVACDAEGFRV